MTFQSHVARYYSDTDCHGTLNNMETIQDQCLIVGYESGSV